MFECSVLLSATRSLSPACRRHTITFTTAGEFAAICMNSSFYIQDKLTSPLCPETFISDFYSTCSGIVDCVALFRSISTKPKPDPWLNDTTRALRRRCRNAERWWKRDKLHVSLGILRDTIMWPKYPFVVQVAKCHYLSNVIFLQQ